MKTKKKNRQRKARRIMLVATIRMCKDLGINFDRKNMESIRDIYVNVFGIDKLVRSFDIASIIV